MMKIIQSLVFSLFLSISASVFAAPININTADAATLSSELTGIGEKRAAAIIAYREANGPFKSADELMKIKGIGESILQKNAANIVTK